MGQERKRSRGQRTGQGIRGELRTGEENRRGGGEDPRDGLKVMATSQSWHFPHPLNPFGLNR